MLFGCALELKFLTLNKNCNLTYTCTTPVIHLPLRIMREDWAKGFSIVDVWVYLPVTWNGIKFAFKKTNSYLWGNQCWMSRDNGVKRHPSEKMAPTAKRAYCSSRGLEICSQQVCVSLVTGSVCESSDRSSYSFPASTGTRAHYHTRHTNIHICQNDINIFKWIGNTNLKYCDLSPSFTSILFLNLFIFIL